MRRIEWLSGSTAPPPPEGDWASGRSAAAGRRAPASIGSGSGWSRAGTADSRPGLSERRCGRGRLRKKAPAPCGVVLPLPADLRTKSVSAAVASRSYPEDRAVEQSSCRPRELWERAASRNPDGFLLEVQEEAHTAHENDRGPIAVSLTGPDEVSHGVACGSLNHRGTGASTSGVRYATSRSPACNSSRSLTMLYRSNTARVL